MNPQIRYCKTSDGVRIAYWTVGSGPALVHAPPGPGFGHIAAELALDDVRAWYERMARTHTLIRYDPRGCGASGSEANISTETLALDFEAVCDALEPNEFTLLAAGPWAFPAIAFAARTRHQLAHLILWGGYARSSDRLVDNRLFATRSLIDQDWIGYTNAWAQTAFGWGHAGQAKAWARLFSEATTPERQLRFIEGVMDGSDVTGLLRGVAAETLVVRHRLGKFSPSAEASQVLAAGLPNARLVVLDGEGYPFTSRIV
jgi:pimeloyl-ACP methyl ester carboxylesterase